MIGALITLGIVVVVGLVVASVYNKLVTLRNRFKNAFSQIDHGTMIALKERSSIVVISR